MDNATRRQILERVKQLGYPNTLEALQNPQVLDQYEQQLQAQSQQQQQPIQQPQPVTFPTPPATTPNYKVPQPRQSEVKPLVMSFNETAPQLMKNGGPKDKGWKEYKTPAGESLYLDPRFKDQRYYVNEKGDHITPNQNMSLFDVQDNIWESGTSMAPLEVHPRYAYKQVPGALGAMETIRYDLDNGTNKIITPDVMETKREGEKFINSFNPAGMATEGLISIGQGNVGEGLTELALSSPLLPKLLSKVGRQELKQGVSNVVERTSNSDVAKVIDTNTGITFKNKSIPSTMDYLQRRQFAKELQKQGLVGKDFGWDDVNYASRSADKLNALTKLALERDATKFRGVKGSIPPGGKGFKDYASGEFDMNYPKWGAINDDATGYARGLSEIENMKQASVDFDSPLSIAEYQASHVPMDDYGYRAGMANESYFGGLYTGDLPTYYGDYMIKMKLPRDYSTGDYLDWYMKYFPKSTYHDLLNIGRNSSNRSLDQIKFLRGRAPGNPVRLSESKGAGDATIIGERGKKMFDVDQTYPFADYKNLTPEQQKLYNEFIQQYKNDYETGWRGQYKKGGKLKDKKCYTCNSSKLKVLYNKANYKK
jgi:hypothetical protein